MSRYTPAEISTVDRGSNSKAQGVADEEAERLDGELLIIGLPAAEEARAVLLGRVSNRSDRAQSSSAGIPAEPPYYEHSASLLDRAS
jgi:hypothetical protein